jgi:hypothetical protein
MELKRNLAGHSLSKRRNRIWKCFSKEPERNPEVPKRRNEVRHCLLKRRNRFGTDYQSALLSNPQGLLGKFGAVPLSDISGFVELPDGKVLSGTESGTLLLWDGGFIKCEITRPGGIPCHAGNVECVQLDRKRRQLITAGHDGYARVWDFDVS